MKATRTTTVTASEASKAITSATTVRVQSRDRVRCMLLWSICKRGCCCCFDSLPTGATSSFRSIPMESPKSRFICQDMLLCFELCCCCPRKKRDKSSRWKPQRPDSQMPNCSTTQGAHADFGFPVTPELPRHDVHDLIGHLRDPEPESTHSEREQFPRRHGHGDVSGVDETLGHRRTQVHIDVRSPVPYHRRGSHWQHLPLGVADSEPPWRSPHFALEIQQCLDDGGVVECGCVAHHHRHVDVVLPWRDAVVTQCTQGRAAHQPERRLVLSQNSLCAVDCVCGE